MLFHVLNRGVGRMQIFQAEKDYDAFQRVVEQTLRVAPIRICAYCWMPNHWHFILWPERDGCLSKFMQRMPSPLHGTCKMVSQTPRERLRGLGTISFVQAKTLLTPSDRLRTSHGHQSRQIA
jgi:REP element-mobilizing transposase RayT